MMSHSPPSSPDSDFQQPEKRCKGIVLLKSLIAIRNSGVKLDLEFDDDGETIGKNADKLKSYIGVLARTKVPIDIDKWKDVPMDLKEKIWEDVLTIFNVPSSLKKEVISTANSRWTNFKTRLTSLYVYKKGSKKRRLSTEDDPLKKYHFIKADVWKRFKATRMTAEFRAMSKIAAEKQKHNIYPHTMSRGGYRKTKIKLKKKLLASKGLSSDDNTKNSGISFDRGDLWVEGRVTKDGKCLNLETEEAIDRINSLKEQVSQKLFVPNGKYDILTEALGTPEHYGRVRGVGGKVGHKKYFGKCTYRQNSGISNIDLELLTQTITEKVRADTIRNMELYFEQREMGPIKNLGANKRISAEEEAQVHINAKRVNVGCYVGDDAEPDPFANIGEKGIECHLAIVDLELHIVALGRVFKNPNEASRSHCILFGENEARVSIDIVLEGEDDAPLPYPTEEFSNVGEAQGSFVRWPKNLIIFGHPKVKDVENSKKMALSEKSKDVDIGKSRKEDSEKSKTKKVVDATKKALVENIYANRKLLSTVANIMDDRRPTTITLKENVMGYEQTIYISKEDITQLLHMEELNVPCIQTFVGFLHSICDSEMYGFLCPEIISLINHNVDKASKYVSKTMNKERKRFYLAPYYQANHWMLALIDVVEHNDIYWFDPLGNHVPSEFKTFINTAIRVYGYLGGKRKSSSVLPKWTKVNCARQPGLVECGYYVMRYMLEIIYHDHSLETIDKKFRDTMPYLQEEIDQVRDQWASYFLNV